MTTPETWYETAPPEATLAQGDLIFDCPLIAWKAEPVQSESAEDLRGAVEAVSADVVVMTQACDLEQEKVENVIMCPHYALSEYRSQWEATMNEQRQNPTDKAWRKFFENVRAGYLWNLMILNSNADGVELEHRIVDFHEVYTAPREFLESLTTQRGTSRLRLVPPYREHLSQAFARFFMRVGLPVDVKTPW